MAHPGWFGAVMATSVLAGVLNVESQILDLPWVATVGGIVLIVASVLSVLLLPSYLRRLRAHGTLREQIGDPVVGPMLATFPAGVLLLASAWGLVGPNVVPLSVAIAVCAVLAAVGTVFALGFSLAWNVSPDRGAQGLAGVNGAWLIPPMGLALVSMALVPLIGAWPDAAVTLIAVAMVFLGAGLMISLVMFSILVARLIFHPQLPAALAPTMWIPLAPAGVLGVAAIRLSTAAELHGLVGPSVPELGIAVAVIGLGFGVWWAAFAAVDLVRIRRHGPVPFQPGWFAFLFPPSALVLSLVMVTSSIANASLAGVTVVCVLGLVLLWAYVLLRSIPLIISAVR